jgi:hypothetical protein
MIHILRAALGFVGIHQPTPIKYAWCALTAVSLILRVIAIWRIDILPALRLYLAATICATVLQNSPWWGIASEVALIVPLALFTTEILYRQSYTVAHYARGYDRQFSALIGLIVLGAMLFFVPPAYSGYPKALYYARVYSTEVAFTIVVSACAFAWSMRVRMPALLRAHGLLAAAWLGAILWAGAVRGMDRWNVAVISTAWQVACLIIWMVVAATGSRGKSRPTAPVSVIDLRSAVAADRRTFGRTRVNSPSR